MASRDPSPPLPVHNTTASITNLARSVLTAVDARSEKTQVQTATLVLLLNALVDMAEPRVVAQARETQERSVRQLVAQVETAVKERDEDQQQAAGGTEPRRRAWG